MEKVILELKNSLDKSTTENAERMLRSFYRTIEPHYKRRFWQKPESISWEVYAEKGYIGFFVVAPKRLEHLIRGRIVDAYPQVDIKAIEVDHLDKFKNPFTAKMDLHKHFMFATKMDGSDGPLNSVLNSMTGLEEDERMLMQVSLLPINDKWQGVAYRLYREMLFHGRKPSLPGSYALKGVAYSIKVLLKPLDWVIGSIMSAEDGDLKNTPIERKELRATQEKIGLPAFNTSIRLAAESPDPKVSSIRLTGMANSFIEVDGDNEWRRCGNKVNNQKIMVNIRERKVDISTNNKVTTGELSSLVRLANKNIIVSEIVNKLMKTLPIPQGLENGVYLGIGIHNSEEIPLYNSEEHVDSFVHPWMVSGAMGGGKTSLILNMMLERSKKYGVIVMDTQGDLTHDFISQLPEEDLERVVWLNFGDFDFPVALDMLEAMPTENPEHRKFMTDFAKEELVSLFKKMFGINFGPQTEYIVRHIITATMETGQSSFIEMFRMLVDDNYREEIAAKIKYKAPFCWSFWRNFQDNFSEPQKMRMVMPSINKIGSFVEKRIIRNITSQGIGSQNYSFRKMMDEGKIVVVTIPKGRLIGTWDLVGRLVISKIWLASLSRESIPIHARKPCFLFVDEAEDLIEDSDNFDIMLSQSRKYRLGLVFGFQYLRQVQAANKRVYDALIGNKPNIVALKIGKEDAETYESIFKGYYSKEDMDFPDLHGIAKLNIKGAYSTPFTLKIPYNPKTKDNSPRDYNEELLQKVMDNSRRLYAKPLKEVEAIVDRKYSTIIETVESIVDEGSYDVEVEEDLLNTLR